MLHTMIDLETMGVSAGCAIVSIGAVEFDPNTGLLGREFYDNVDLQSCLDAGLRVDGSTIMWWMSQDDAARKALSVNPKALSIVLNNYKLWFNASSLVWSHGASFDHTVLSAAYRATGIELPWKFRNERDTRTIFDLSGVKMKASVGTYHNALCDAKTQALAVMEAYDVLKGKTNASRS